MILSSGIIQGLISNGLSTLLFKIFANTRLLILKIYKPNAEIRIAFSAIIRMRIKGQYILVRNLHRPETFCPFGGVYKYYEDALPFLDRIDFHQHIVDAGKDMDNDMRGFLPRKNLTKLIDWYNKKIERESYGECLSRELREEIVEAGINISFPDKMKFRFVRDIIEKPKYNELINCYQFRIFEVYDIQTSDKQVNQFINRVYSMAKKNSNLIVVSADEIKRGRSSEGELIGSHSPYLLSHKKYRADDPMFVNLNAKGLKQL